MPADQVYPLMGGPSPQGGFEDPSGNTPYIVDGAYTFGTRPAELANTQTILGIAAATTAGNAEDGAYEGYGAFNINACLERLEDADNEIIIYEDVIGFGQQAGTSTGVIGLFGFFSIMNDEDPDSQQGVGFLFDGDEDKVYAIVRDSIFGRNTHYRRKIDISETMGIGTKSHSLRVEVRGDMKAVLFYYNNVLVDFWKVPTGGFLRSTGRPQYAMVYIYGEYSSGGTARTVLYHGGFSNPYRLRFGEYTGTAIAAGGDTPDAPTISCGGVTDGSVRVDATSLTPITLTHLASRWQITTSGDTTFASPIGDSGWSCGDLNSFLFEGLSEETSYLLRVRYGTTGGVSDWSNVVTCTTIAGGGGGGSFTDPTPPGPSSFGSCEDGESYAWTDEVVADVPAPADPPLPDPGEEDPPATEFSNIPAGYSEITTTDWSDRELKPGLWNHVDLLFAGTSSVIEDPGSPNDTGYSLLYEWVTGSNADSIAPARDVYEPFSLNAVFLGGWIKVNNDFHGHRTGAQKYGPFVVDSGSGDNIFIILYGADDGELSLAIANNSGGHSMIADPLLPNVGVPADAVITRGQWHKYELQLDRGLGLIKLWLDGTLICNYTSQVFDNTAFGIAKWDPVWGGLNDSMPSPPNKVWFGYTSIWGRAAAP